MIKIRLHGERAEINAAIETIRQNFEILSKSDIYADRGESKYYRAYLDCRLLDPDEYLERNETAIVQGGGTD